MRILVLGSILGVLLSRETTLCALEPSSEVEEGPGSYHRVRVWVLVCRRWGVDPNNSLDMIPSSLHLLYSLQTPPKHQQGQKALEC